jgi:ubiquinone/menaquinone biosynthesis C-methylase UbiE
MKTSPQFYKELGAETLAARKSEAHTKKELSYLKKYLNKKHRILDLACGYGRFTIPLARQGYKIQGIDISPNLIAKAKITAKKEGLTLKFKMGDMRKLPYKEDSFDSIICMWSAFIELSKEKDQIKALKEMLRVLKKGGFAFLEMPEPRKTKEKVDISIIAGVETVPMYRQNKTTMKRLIDLVKPQKCKIFVDNFGGRDRLLVLFWK